KEPPAHRGQRRQGSGSHRDAEREEENRSGAGAEGGSAGAVGGVAPASRGGAGLPQGRRAGGGPARGAGGGAGRGGDGPQGGGARGGGRGGEVTVRKAVDAAEPKIAGAFQDQPIVDADVRDTLGSTYLHLGEATLAIRQFERALELRRTRLGPDNVDTLASRN